MVLRRSIEKLLVESANTCKWLSSKSVAGAPDAAGSPDAQDAQYESRGRKTERAAARWLRSRGDQIVLERFETPYAEVDILAMRPTGNLLLCEVKSSFWPDDRGLGLGPRQRQRLARAAAWIASETSRDVEIVMLGPSTRSGQFEEIPIF